MPHLTKSMYVAGDQCLRRLWLHANAEHEAAPPDEAIQRRFRQGTEVGKLAQTWFPGGVAISPLHADVESLVRETREAIDGGADVLYEAAFLEDGVFVAVDILERTDDNGWHLVEVKASTKVKPHHLEDVAIQAHVLERAGLSIDRVSLMVVNTDCDHDEVDEALFTLRDVTARLGEARDVEATLARYREILARDLEPDVPIGRHCRNPHPCPFFDHCTRDIDGPTILDAQDMHWRIKDRLRQQGIVRLADVPLDFDMNGKARAGLRRQRRQEVDVDVPALRRMLDELVYPLCFFDFETDQTPIPPFPGTHPYQQIPFQYSLHVLHESGRMEHREYLHTDRDDPREPLAERLVEHMPATGTIVAYFTNFERDRLKELARDVPHLAEPLESMTTRLWDQLDVFKKVYRHHGFGASNSLKSVLPVIAPDLDYGELEVQNGTQAQVAWDRIQAREPGWEELADQLRAYCERDTWAMVVIHRHLVEAAYG